jgi:hypothetical protein
MLPLFRLVTCLLCLAAPLCANPVTGLAVEGSLRPVARTEIALPKARWDHRGEAASWSSAALRALSSHASVLPQKVPRDIAEWCPAYPTADTAQRKHFWVGLLSALAKHESTYRPGAVGGGGKWYGLLQILPATARGYNCKARTGTALKDGTANLSCALRIMSVTVPRDGVISHGMRGVAADWGPFHSRRKREDMKAWTRGQAYCTAIGKSLRPVARPIVQSRVTP